jgi:hypothetical protein
MALFDCFEILLSYSFWILRSDLRHENWVGLSRSHDLRWRLRVHFAGPGLPWDSDRSRIIAQFFSDSGDCNSLTYFTANEAQSVNLLALKVHQIVSYCNAKIFSVNIRKKKTIQFSSLQMLMVTVKRATFQILRKNWWFVVPRTHQ